MLQFVVRRLAPGREPRKPVKCSVPAAPRAKGGVRVQLAGPAQGRGHRVRVAAGSPGLPADAACKSASDADADARKNAALEQLKMLGKIALSRPPQPGLPADGVPALPARLGSDPRVTGHCQGRLGGGPRFLILRHDKICRLRPRTPSALRAACLFPSHPGPAAATARAVASSCCSVVCPSPQAGRHHRLRPDTGSETRVRCRMCDGWTRMAVLKVRRGPPGPNAGWAAADHWQA